MKSITDILIKDYTYALPAERIAKAPLEDRSGSRLLLYKEGKISYTSFNKLSDHLPENNLLVRNNTRVIQARLNFRKSTGANIEIFCLEPISPASYEENFACTNMVEWTCLVGNARKWKSETLTKEIQIENDTIILKASKMNAEEGNYLIRFEWTGDIPYSNILEHAGSTPIPPYLNRQAEMRDKKWYQTVYAKFNGSVAAPTAGLHFTPEVFKSLGKKKIQIADLTLHVGAGTFRPVQSERITDHTMHVETMVVSKTAIHQLIKSLPDGITAIGTTSLRTLESLYWLGVKLSMDITDNFEDLVIEQWDPYQNWEELQPAESLSNISGYLEKKNLDELHFATRLIIVPGYKIRIANRLITNFHQPGSTLLLLVASFIGNDWKKVYEYALDNDFRFLSYGDSSILEYSKIEKTKDQRPKRKDER